MIDLDAHATTPADPRLPALQRYGNPGSSHLRGRRAAAAVGRGRAQVAAAVGARPEQVVFTSGATEANHLALCGALAQRPGHVVTTSLEHPSVAAPLARWRAQGGALTVVPCGPSGVMELPRVMEAVRPDTALVSVMLVNNELGTVQPVAALGAALRDHPAWLHTDASQALGRVALDVEALGVQLLTLSSHKAYGPMGVGALVVREPAEVRPWLVGGGQEAGRRSGTLNVPGIVGFGAACALAAAEWRGDEARLRVYRDGLWARLQEALGARLNGCLERRVAGNLNVWLPGVEAASLLSLLDGEVALSTGSACRAGAALPSPVLMGIGRSEEAALCSLRIGLGRFTTAREVEEAGSKIIGAAAQLLRWSPG